MKEKRKKTGHLPGKTKAFMLGFLMVILFAGAVIFWQFQKRVLSSLDMQAEYSLKSVSSQNALLAEVRIQDRKNLLRAIANEIAESEPSVEKEVLTTLKSYAENFGFYSMGIVDQNGICYTILGETLDLSQYEYFQKTMEGKEIVTEGYLSENRKNEVNIFTMPINRNTGEKMALTAVYRTEDFLKMMDIRSFDGKGGSIVVDSKGKLISGVSGSIPQVVLDIESYLVSQEKDQEEENRNGIFSVQSSDTSYLACEEDLSINGWKLVSFVEEDYLYRDTKSLNRVILLLLLALYMLIAVIAGLYMTVYHRFHKSRKYYEEMAKRQAENRKVEKEFKEALRKKEFQVWYQPKYNMEQNRICGAEALVRWMKNGKFQSPEKFISQFERTGHIVRLDEEILKIVCQDIRDEKKKGSAMGPVSVNLSRMNLFRRDITQRIWKITKKYNIQPGELSFEITESDAAQYDKEDLNHLVDKLHDMGFQVDIDDYGTGSSNLKSLAYTHFDTLKLDRSFVRLIGDKKIDTIICSTIYMALQLHMNIVAEGVETKEQAGFLERNKCFTVQGYYFFKPMPKELYQKTMDNERKRRQ